MLDTSSLGWGSDMGPDFRSVSEARVYAKRHGVWMYIYDHDSVDLGCGEPPRPAAGVRVIIDYKGNVSEVYKYGEFYEGGYQV